jgi:hypothetical protein
MSWRAHKGWVAEVQFLQAGSGGAVEGSGGSRVLTAANDAAVKVRRPPAAMEGCFVVARVTGRTRTSREGFDACFLALANSHGATENGP